ncbi:MAG: hypothetical protein ACREEQ_03310, partial [Caulobacteraceae bacterium]
LEDCVEGYVDRLGAEYGRTDPADPVAKRLFDASLADFRAHRPRYRLLLRAPPSEGSHAKLVRWNDETQAFMRAKLESDGTVAPMEAALLADVLSAFIDGVCVRAVLEEEGDLATLGRRIGEFLARIERR